MTMKLRAVKLKAAFLAAVVAVLILMPGAAQAQATNGWSATLTVQNAAGDIGCSTAGVTTQRCSAALDDNDFEYGGVDYEITQISVGSGSLALILDRAIPDSLKNSGLALYVGTTQLRLADGTRSTVAVANDALTWSNTGLSWSAGDTVQLRLTVQVSQISPPLPTLTASVSPDPIVEGSELWSATLTVQDLDTTPASAPTNRGCDDSQGGSARCSSALTDNDFTFKGVEYTVKAISYNQRKVAVDTSTFTVTTYPESLKLTLDKAIPASLQSCLTLHAGNVKVPFADDGLAGAGVDTELSTSNGVANSTLTLKAIGALNAGDFGWGLNWSAGDTVMLRLPNVGCLTLTLSEPVTEDTSMQIRLGGTASSDREPDADYRYSKLPVFANGSTTASRPIEVIDDSAAEGCENITMTVTVWPGEARAISEYYRVYIEDSDGGAECPPLSQRSPFDPGGL